MDIAKILNDVTNHDLLGWKTALATVVVLLAALQVALAGRFWASRGLPVGEDAAATIHRWNGRVLLVLSLVVGYACLMGPAGTTTPARLLIHSMLGCTLFALICAKLLAVRVVVDRQKSLPLIGIALFANYVLIWITSILDYVVHPNAVTPAGTALQIWVWVLSTVAGVLGGIGIVAFVRSRPGPATPPSPPVAVPSAD